ncbi:MAG: hypothetical protein Q9186_000913 [Xanthomendoza sp. 1 TL-2023]
MQQSSPSWPGFIPHNNNNESGQTLSPRQLHQQLQLLSHFHQLPSLSPPPPTHNNHQAGGKSPDPNRRALLARLAALNNPSILGAIPEDSILTASSYSYPTHHHNNGGGHDDVVNQYWADIKERRMQEARERGEVVEMEVNGGDEVGGGMGGKKVRFREREWAVLASDTGV